MKGRRRMLGYLAAGTAALVCGLVIGVMLSVIGTRPAQDESASSSRPQPRVTRPSGRIIAPHWGSNTVGTDAVIVMLRNADWSTCEDLARQLRELRRATLLRGLPLYVYTDAASYPELAVRVRRENIRPDTIHVVDLTMELAGLSEAATPAALRVSPAGNVVVGVAHIGSVPGHRTESFTQELGLSAH